MLLKAMFCTKIKVSVQKSEELDKLTSHSPPSLYHNRNESGDTYRNTRMTMEMHAKRAYDDAVTRHSIISLVSLNEDERC